MTANPDLGCIPKLSVVSSTRYSVTLTWTGSQNRSSVYKLQLKDRKWGWITKYWGFRTQSKVESLGPEECYYFRVGTTEFKSNTYKWSEIIPAITKDDHIAVINLHRAVQYGNINIAKKFLTNRLNAVNSYDRNGKSALMNAAMKGDTQLMNILITSGASVDFPSLHSRLTALMIAAWHGQQECVSLLIENGADWNARDNHGCSPVHYAVDNSQTAILRMAIEMGADINLKDANGWTPLIRGVILHSNKEVLNELVNNGADVNVTGLRGQSVLMQAVLSQNLDVIKMLLAAGADPGASNIYNNTALNMTGFIQNQAIEFELAQRQELEVGRIRPQ